MSAPSQYSPKSMLEYNQSLPTDMQDFSSNIFQVPEDPCQLFQVIHTMPAEAFSGTWKSWFTAIIPNNKCLPNPSLSQRGWSSLISSWST